jgi:hypothetical protein
MFSGLSSGRPTFRLTKHFKAALLVHWPAKRASDLCTDLITACTNVGSCGNISTIVLCLNLSAEKILVTQKVKIYSKHTR